MGSGMGQLWNLAEIDSTGGDISVLFVVWRKVSQLRKRDGCKRAMARLIRRRTTVDNAWIARS